MANKKQTSKSVAALATETLQDQNASQIAKRLAASALAQANSRKQTGSDLEEIASKVLKSPKYSDNTKALAASVLAQSSKKR
jgi:hypothetical protein